MQLAKRTGLLALLAVLALLATACKGRPSPPLTPTATPVETLAESPGPTPTATPPAPGPTPTPVATPTPSPTPEGFASGIADLVRAVVRVDILVQVGGAFEPVASGSGTIIDPSGLILTNYHVAFFEDEEFDRLGILITESTDQPPVATYFAEVVTADKEADLAVLRITADAANNPVCAENLKLLAVRIGDSDQVEIGDELTIIGYPGIGGLTVTITSGRVSGFEAALGQRIWIETDALVSFGNSGGGAFNSEAQLVGIPTGVNEENIDRLGDRLNLLRPVNLAQQLVENARAGRRTVFSGEEAEPCP